MLAAVARTINPPDFTRRSLGGQRLQHREHGSDPNAGTQQDDRRVAGPQREIAAWRADLKHVAELDLRLDVGPGSAVRFPLDADSVAMLARHARQRIGAQQCWRLRCRLSRNTMNCPGKAACSGCPSVGSRVSDVTLLLSRFLSDTCNGRKPAQAGGGPTPGASAGLPVIAPPLCARSSNARKESRQPALKAGMRNAFSRLGLG